MNGQMIGDRTGMSDSVKIDGVEIGPQHFGRRVTMETVTGGTVGGTVEGRNHIYVFVRTDGERIARPARSEMLKWEV